jgi:hypothetical protein
MRVWIKDGIALFGYLGLVACLGGIIQFTETASRIATTYTHSAPLTPIESADASGAEASPGFTAPLALIQDAE